MSDASTIRDTIMSRIPASVDTLEKYKVWTASLKKAFVPPMSDTEFDNLTLSAWQALHSGN